MGLEALAGPIASAVLQRTYLLEKGTFNFIPRVLIVFDTVDEEDPEFSAEVTEHPVEEGPEVSDHIQLKNPDLTIRGTISNTPTDLSVAIANIISGGIGAVTSSMFRANFINTGIQQFASLAGAALMGGGLSAGSALAAAEDAIARSILLDAWQRKARFDVVTKRQKYEQMVIQKLRFPRNKDTGFQLYYELDLKHIRTVQPLFGALLSTVAEDVVPSASSDTNLGSQAASGVSSQTSDAASGSWLRGIVNGVK